MISYIPDRSVIGCDAGTVGVTFSITLMLGLMCVGGAIDFGRAYSMRSAMQRAGDAAALNSVTSDATLAAQNLAPAQSLMAERVERYGGTGSLLKAKWLSETDYEIVASAEMPTAFLRAMPGKLTKLRTSTRSVARGYKLKVVGGPPSKIDLSYEAADYNQVWAYCFDPKWQINGTRANDEGTQFKTFSGSLTFVSNVAANQNKSGRSDFTLIADNGGSTIPLTMPSCKEGETVSYMLFNSRNNRTTPSNWKKNHTTCGTSLSQTNKSCYMWFTDAKPDANGVERHNGTSPHQLETVLCDDANCSQPQGGATIPGNNQKNRIPQVAQACEPGKFMYFGWEDRPPQNQGGNGTGAPYAAGTVDPGGDRDYDDIRLIMSCPHLEKDTLQVRLVE